MPATSDRKGGLDWRNPGAKEYVIVGGTALGLALAYFWWKGRHGGTPPAAAPSSAPAASPTGMPRQSLMLWIQDHAASPRRKPREHREGGGGVGPPTRKWPA